MKPRTLAELDEAARAMAEQTGMGYERCLVELQAKDRGFRSWRNGFIVIGIDASRFFETIEEMKEALRDAGVDVDSLVEVDWPFSEADQ